MISKPMGVECKAEVAGVWPAWRVAPPHTDTATAEVSRDVWSSIRTACDREVARISHGHGTIIIVPINKSPMKL